MSDSSEFFLNSGAGVVLLDCFEISHSLFTQTYYVVRNAPNGVTVTHEDSTTHAYEYYPLQCTKGGSGTNLEQSISVQFGDLGEILPKELDLIRAGNGFDEYPAVKYRAYRSDDLTHVMDGTAIYLEIRDLDFNREGCSFVAKAPSLNISKTGELFKIGRFPMLRGLL
jgi:hypothetical protein